MNPNNPKKFNPYSPARILIVIKRHVPMVLKPAIFAIIMLGLWDLLRHHGIFFTTGSELPFTTFGAAFLAIAYGILATLVISSIWDDYKKVSFTLIQNDKKTFLLYRDERMPIMIHLLLGILSFFLLAFAMMTQWNDGYAGGFTIFSIAFIIALFFFVAIELNDPKQSIWFKERIPAEWLAADIDEIIKNKELSP